MDISTPVLQSTTQRSNSAKLNDLDIPVPSQHAPPRPDVLPNYSPDGSRNKGPPYRPLASAPPVYFDLNIPAAAPPRYNDAVKPVRPAPTGPPGPGGASQIRPLRPAPSAPPSNVVDRTVQFRLPDSGGAPPSVARSKSNLTQRPQRPPPPRRPLSTIESSDKQEKDEVDGRTASIENNRTVTFSNGAPKGGGGGVSALRSRFETSNTDSNGNPVSRSNSRATAGGAVARSVSSVGNKPKPNLPPKPSVSRSESDC